MSSTTVFDVRDARYARVQERTFAVQRAVIGAGLSSEATVKAALLLNGRQQGPGDQFMGLSEARGAGSFDVHEHVMVAPSHLLFFNLASPLLQQVYNAISVLQRDEFLNDMRACYRYVPRHTVLKAFEPEKMGGTTLSMSDYAVLLTIAPTVLDDIVGSRAHMHLDVICCISPHLERCTRHQDSSRRALRNICLHLVVIF